MENGYQRRTIIFYISVGLSLFYLSAYLLNTSIQKPEIRRNNALGLKESVNKQRQAAVAEEELKIRMAEVEDQRQQLQREQKKFLKMKRLQQQKQQPTSHISLRRIYVLPTILQHLYEKHSLCTPEDVHNEAKHRIPSKIASKTSKMNEPRAVMVIYIAIGLLLTSLGAALLDFFRAKSDQNSADGAKKKHMLTRKCSLADLTVLRHSRKESMRKDSIYDGNPTNQVIGRKVSRPPLRLD